MVKIKVYDTKAPRDYMFPNGEMATPAVIEERFPAMAKFTHVIETDEAEEVIWAVQNLAAMRALYNISSALAVDEAVAELERIRNAPLPAPEVTAEERIAAALEFQALSAL